MKKILVCAVALMALTSACTSSSSGGDSDKGKAEGSAGLPVTVEVGNARDQLYAAMKGKKIAFIPTSLDTDLQKLWANDFTRTFKMLGAKLTIDDPGFDVDKMVQMVDSRINDDVDMIIVQNPDVGVLSKQVETAQKKGIYFVSINVQGAQSSDAYVGADYVAMSRDLGTRIVADCKAKGKKDVGVLNGWGTDAQSISFVQGLLPVLKEGGLNVVSNQQSDYDPDKANKIATAVLQKNQDLCAFAVVFDLTASGAAQAVKSAGLQGKVGVYNMDASASWCDGLKAGDYVAGTSYEASGISVAAAAAAQQLFLVGAPAGTTRTMAVVPHTVVDKDNVDSVQAACYGGK
jgi:ribose transport system substrate-binding protein